jgi:hypothetical protein
MKVFYKTHTSNRLLYIFFKIQFQYWEAMNLIPVHISMFKSPYLPNTGYHGQRINIYLNPIIVGQGSTNGKLNYHLQGAYK